MSLLPFIHVFTKARWETTAERVWEGKAALGTPDVGLHDPYVERVVGMIMLKHTF